MLRVIKKFGHNYCRLSAIDISREHISGTEMQFCLQCRLRYVIGQNAILVQDFAICRVLKTMQYVTVKCEQLCYFCVAMLAVLRIMTSNIVEQVLPT